MRHKDDLANTSCIQKRRDQMAKWGWTMGMGTIMGVLPTNPQNTGTAAKPLTSTHKTSTDGLGNEAAPVLQQHPG